MLRRWLTRQNSPRPTIRRNPAPQLLFLEDRTTPATFYVDPTFTGLTAGDKATFNAGQPNENTGVVVGTDGFASIAAAITAANATPQSDTLLLSNATHDVDPSGGTLAITAPLVLTGSGKDASIVRVVGDTAAATGAEGAVFRADQVRFDVSDLTLDGGGADGSPAGASFLVGSGFRFNQAAGSVKNVTIQKVIDDSDPTTSLGYGVVVIGDGANVAIDNARFVSIGRIGVTFYGGATGSISNSTLTGRSAGVLGIGVEVAEGGKNVLITGNTFTGYTGSSATFASSAIQVADNLDADFDGDGNNATEPATAAIIGNSITNGQNGIVVGIDPTLDNSTAIVQFNTITGNEIGTITDTAQTVNALYNFFGPGGPKATGNTTGSGDNPGGTGNEVGAKTQYSQAGANPNNGILVNAPPVQAVTAAPGATLADIAAAAATNYLATTQYDVTPSQLTVAGPASYGPNGLTVTFTFDEAVTGYTAGDIQLGGSETAATITSFTPSADGKTYVAVIAAPNKGTVTVKVNTGAAQDANGNFSAALAETTVGTPDFTAPVITITSPAGALPVPYSNPLTLTVSFNESVAGFTASDIVIAGTAQGGTVTGFAPSADSKTFTVTVSGFTARGDVTLTIPAGAAQDLAGNATPAAGPITVATADVVAPVASFAGVPQPYQDPSAVTVNFSEPVSGLDATDFTITGTPGGTILSIVANAGRTSFDVTIGGFDGRGDVFLALAAGAATDDAGNPSTAVATTLIATADTTAPTLTVTAADAGTLPRPYADSVTLNFVFSETVTGFDRNDIVLTGTQAGGTVTSLTPLGDGLTYAVTIGGFTTPGSLSVAVAAGAARDTAGNDSTALATTAVLNDPADTVPPTATFTLNGGTLGGNVTTAPVTFTVTFSEPVTGFTAEDVKLTGTAGGSVTSVTNTGDGKTYTVVVNGLTTAGSVVVGLDAGAVSDVAGNASGAIGPVTVAQFAKPFSRGFAVGGDRLLANQPFYQLDENFKAQAAVVPFSDGFTGGIRVATADVDGDGVLDTIVGSGVGRASEVRVYSGASNATLLFTLNPFEASFTGGVFVTGADLDGDGKAEIIVTPDESGGPRVVVFDGATRAQRLSFFGIDDANFRGGARTGVGDLNGDGTPDLFVAAGFGGGPRVAIFDGADLLDGKFTRLTSDFFGYEEGLRNGVYVAGGDLNGDGFADVILGAGPGGGPRVRVLDGKSLLTSNVATEVGNFFAGDPNSRAGVRVTAKDLDGDNRIDIVTGPGEGAGSKVSVYYGKTIAAAGTPAVARELSLFGDFSNGVYVG